MNAVATAAPLASSEVDNRIAAERERLAGEQAAEIDLLAKRLAPLESGDDAALDKIESQIVACRERQKRIEERIQILDRRAEEARGREHAASLDRLELRAQRARERGEKLILGDYARHASALAATLKKLAAIEGVIEGANRILGDAERSGVPSPNAIRCRLPSVFEKSTKRTVNVYSELHPLFGKARIVRPDNNYNTTPYLVDSTTNERLPHPVELEVEFMAPVSDSGDYPTPLERAVTLPGVGPAPAEYGLADLWNERSTRDMHESIDALTREIDAELEGSTLGKIGRAAARTLGLGEKSK